nr:myoneurin isoform X1 [Aedes albopictus]XP_029731138.1 myoneurin isoform X1 [Aedes albopictus]
MENTCNFCAYQDASVLELEKDYYTDKLSTLRIAARHLWFTHDELKSFYICDSCRSKLLDFHHFYCQVRKLYSAKPVVEKSKLESVPITTTDEIELKPAVVEPGPVGDDVENLSNDHDQESIDATESGNHSNEKLSKDPPREIEYLPTITDEDIRIFCQMVCHICSEEFDYFEDLKHHCAQEHDTKCYVHCCNSRLDALHKVKDHILIHLKPDTFRCNKCDKNFTTKTSLTRHLKTAGHLSANDQVFECNLCSKKYPGQQMLDDHMQSHQNETTIHKCTQCPKEFTSFEKLAFHTGVVHNTNEMSQHCKICNKLFDNVETFNAHRGTNLCVDPQLADAVKVGRISVRKCMICDKTFQRKRTYREHMALHAGELAFSCDFCDRSYKNETSMYLHRKRKHPEEYKRMKMAQMPG